MGEKTSIIEQKSSSPARKKYVLKKRDTIKTDYKVNYERRKRCRNFLDELAFYMFSGKFTQLSERL